MEQEYKEIMNKDGVVVTHSLDGAEPQTAANYGVFFIAPYKCEIVAVYEAHQVGGDHADPVTLQIERLQGTEALDAGDELLATAIDLKGAANTVVYPSLTLTYANKILSRGDRLALKDTGNLQTIVGLCVTVVINPLGQGHYRKI